MCAINTSLKIDDELAKKLGIFVDAEVIWSVNDDDRYVELVVEVGETSTEIFWVVYDIVADREPPPKFATLELAIDHINKNTSS